MKIFVRRRGSDSTGSTAKPEGASGFAVPAAPTVQCRELPPPELELGLAPKRLTAEVLRTLLTEAVEDADSLRLWARWTDGQQMSAGELGEVFHRANQPIEGLEVIAHFSDGSNMDLTLAGRCGRVAGTGRIGVRRAQQFAAYYRPLPARHAAPLMVVIAAGLLALLAPALGWLLHSRLAEAPDTSSGLHVVLFVGWAAVAMLSGWTFNRFAARMRVARIVVLPALLWHRAHPELAGALVVGAVCAALVAGIVLLI